MSDYFQIDRESPYMLLVALVVDSRKIAMTADQEKLFGIDITPRCKAVRTILNELARIQNHLLCVGAAGLDLGSFTGFLYGFNERERIYDIVELMTGQRYRNNSYTRVGGLNMDQPDEDVFRKLVKALIDEQLPRALEDVEKLLTRNRIFVDRTKGVSALTREEAIAWSLTGPVARAAGVERDIHQRACRGRADGCRGHPRGWSPRHAATAERSECSWRCGLSFPRPDERGRLFHHRGGEPVLLAGSEGPQGSADAGGCAT